jgi:hypothetical protein
MLEGIAHYHPYVTEWLSAATSGPGMPAP